MTTKTENGQQNKIMVWLLGAVFTVAVAAVGAYAGLTNSMNASAREQLEDRITGLERRIDRLDRYKPRVAALEAKVDQALKSIDRQLGSIEEKVDDLAKANR